jgi:hypothetical protein
LNTRGSVNAPRVPQLGRQSGQAASGAWPCALVALDEVVGAEALVARLAFDQWSTTRDVPAGLLDLTGEDHAGVEPDDVVTA